MPTQEKPPLPRVFIGSSTEGHRIAEYLQLGLEQSAECTIWSQGVFGLSGGTLESLCASAKSFDFAVLVLTPDDLVQKRDGITRGPRDNVLFELGLFMGTLGRNATFIAHCADDAIDLPSDLAGITTARWRRRSDGNLRAALGPVCTQIREVIEHSPARASSHHESSRPDISHQLAQLHEAFAAQSRDLKRIVEALHPGTSGRIETTASEDPGDQWSFLEGTWRNWETHSFAHVRIIGGQVRFPYCYDGNNELTGELYDFKRTGSVLTSRFRWLNGIVLFGYIYLEIVSEDELAGGWWYTPDLRLDEFQKLHDMGGKIPIRGMEPTRWVRDKQVGPVPRWVDDYYRSLGATVR